MCLAVGLSGIDLIPGFFGPTFLWKVRCHRAGICNGGRMTSFPLCLLCLFATQGSYPSFHCGSQEYCFHGLWLFKKGCCLPAAVCEVCMS